VQENPNNNKQAWLSIGLKTLGDEGLNALKINLLCEKLKVSKGCFYYWFKSKSDYENQILELWRHRFTQQFIKLAELGENDQQKLTLLCRQCIQSTLKGNRLEFEINAWTQKSDVVKSFVHKVYKKRYSYLMKILSGIYRDKNEVEKHALILYSLVVGIDFFYRKMTKKELELVFSDYIFKD
jgi:AcrR family transcriptional regulator